MIPYPTYSSSLKAEDECVANRLAVVNVLERESLESYTDLILGTMYVETDCGVNKRNSSSVGAFQIEVKTAEDIIKRFLPRNDGYLKTLNKYYDHSLNVRDNLMSIEVSALLATYLYISRGVKGGTLKENAHNWKLYYNTSMGRGKIKDFLNKWGYYHR